MIDTSLLLAEAPPSLNEIEGFNPGSEDAFINPGTSASSELINHWFFSDALPQWISYLITFSAGAAVLMIVVGGVMLMLNPEQEDMKEKGFKTITWAIAGLIISMLAYSIVEIVNQVPFLGSNPTTDLDIDTGNGIENLAQGDLRSEIIPDIIKIILQLMGTLAFLLLLYAGVLMVIRDGEEEKITKARRLIIYAIVGIAISLVAYIVVEGVIQLNFEKG